VHRELGALADGENIVTATREHVPTSQSFDTDNPKCSRTRKRASNMVKPVCVKGDLGHMANFWLISWSAGPMRGISFSLRAGKQAV
jgi:hypothetical protein